MKNLFVVTLLVFISIVHSYFEVYAHAVSNSCEGQLSGLSDIKEASRLTRKLRNRSVSYDLKGKEDIPIGELRPELTKMKDYLKTQMDQLNPRLSESASFIFAEEVLAEIKKLERVRVLRYRAYLSVSIRFSIAIDALIEISDTDTSHWQKTYQSLRFIENPAALDQLIQERLDLFPFVIFIPKFGAIPIELFNFNSSYMITYIELTPVEKKADGETYGPFGYSEHDYSHLLQLLDNDNFFSTIFSRIRKSGPLKDWVVIDRLRVKPRYKLAWAIAREKKLDHFRGYVFSLLEKEDNDSLIRGVHTLWFLRTHETFQPPTLKFMRDEILHFVISEGYLSVVDLHIEIWSGSVNRRRAKTDLRLGSEWLHRAIGSYVPE